MIEACPIFYAPPPEIVALGMAFLAYKFGS